MIIYQSNEDDDDDDNDAESACKDGAADESEAAAGMRSRIVASADSDTH